MKERIALLFSLVGICLIPFSLAAASLFLLVGFFMTVILIAIKLIGEL